jgi:hypothetical protein
MLNREFCDNGILSHITAAVLQSPLDAGCCIPLDPEFRA